MASADYVGSGGGSATSRGPRGGNGSGRGGGYRNGEHEDSSNHRGRGDRGGDSRGNESYDTRRRGQKDEGNDTHRRGQNDEGNDNRRRGGQNDEGKGNDTRRRGQNDEGNDNRRRGGQTENGSDRSQYPDSRRGPRYDEKERVERSGGNQKYDNRRGDGGEQRGGGQQYESRRVERDEGGSHSYEHRRGPERGIRVPPPRMMRKPTHPLPSAVSTARPYVEEYNDKNCIVCYKEVKYYSVGACDHSVCHECSGRMRVLMEQNECPICRQTLEIVIFTNGLKPFKELRDKLRMFILLPQWGLYLEGDEVNRDFETLLEHRCSYCRDEAQTFPTFKDLKRHVQRDHEMYSCDLCSDNIKLFSRERRFYTRQELATHKRKGDRNDKSHRGHPICEFCDRRYFDHDELYKHLRKDHYFCHFCDADGYNHYYNTYDDLRLHFRKEHFLCEEEHCKDEKFTSVFRSDIDMKAHLTAVHSRLLGKHGTKQARMIDLEFNVKSDEDRRSRRFNGEGFVGRGGRRERGGEYDDTQEMDEMPKPSFEPTIHAQPKVDSVADFPMLEGAALTSVLPVTNGSSHASSSIAQKVALSSGKNVVNKQSSGGGPRWNTKVTGSSRHDEEFPSLGSNDQPLGGGPTPSRLASTILTTTKPPLPAPQQKRNGFARPITMSSAMEEFPSLGNPSGKNGGAWIGTGVKMKGKQTPRSLKVAPPPLERKIEVDPFDDFHFVPLSVSRARKDSLTKKYECIIADEDQELDGKDAEDKLKKKKKNKNDQSSSNNGNGSSNKEKVKAAAALFNGGKTSKETRRDGAKNSSDDFPSLEPVKKSLQQLSPKKSPSSPSPRSPLSNTNISGITMSPGGGGSGPPPGFGSSKPPPKPEDLFDMSFLTVASANNTNHSSKNHNNNTISDELELSKAKAGAVGKLYSQPPEFTRRNARLLEAVKSSLNGDESSFEMFKSVSNQYRKGELNSKEYYELCQDMFGITDFRVIFPELLALLPEIEKQLELLSSHRRAGGLMKDLSTCHECYQVIKSGDMSAHVLSHSAGELFPAL